MKMDMTTDHTRRPDYSTLQEFAFGRLTLEESRRVLEWVEKDPEVSRDLELILHLMGLSDEEWDKLEKPNG
jgi:hypothetical protein